MSQLNYLAEIWTRESWKFLHRGPWFVQPPPLLPLQLQYEDLDVVVMWSETLSSGRRQVHVGPYHAAQKLLKTRAHLPNGLVECLRVEKTKAAALVVEIPHN